MKQKSQNIIWHDGEIQKVDREKALNQRGVVLWFTGYSGAGKSTLAVALEQVLFEKNQVVYRLDGDNVRHGLNADLGFSPEDRTENIRRIGEVAKLFADAGIITTASFISPYKKDREGVRKILPQGDFIEVFVRCDIEKCEERDPKGLYKKVRAGEITGFTGIDAPYEEPETPEIVIDTTENTIEESLEELFAHLVRLGIIHEENTSA